MSLKRKEFNKKLKYFTINFGLQHLAVYILKVVGLNPARINYENDF